MKFLKYLKELKKLLPYLGKLVEYLPTILEFAPLLAHIGGAVKHYKAEMSATDNTPGKLTPAEGADIVATGIKNAEEAGDVPAEYVEIAGSMVILAYQAIELTGEKPGID